jgi:hypothetical protein
MIKKVTDVVSLPEPVAEIRGKLIERKDACIRELLADLLATRMMGLSYFCAISEYLKTTADWSEPTITPQDYPGLTFRLSVVFHHLFGSEFGQDVRHFLSERKRERDAEWVGPLLEFLKTWQERLPRVKEWPTLTNDEKPTTDKWARRELDILLEKVVLGTVEELNRIARTSIPLCATLSDGFFDRVSRLKQDLPPGFSKECPGCFSEIMSAAWAYEIAYDEEYQQGLSQDGQHGEYSKRCRLVMKAVELIPEAEQEPPAMLAAADEEFLKKTGSLDASHIRWRLTLPIEHPSRLDIIPLHPEAIQPASIDLRLGHWLQWRVERSLARST